MVKKIEELKLDEAKKIIGGDKEGCGVCMKCDCDPHGEPTEKASYALGRVLTPKAQGCKPNDLVNPL